MHLRSIAARVALGLLATVGAVTVPSTIARAAGGTPDVFAFGASFYGSADGLALARPIVGIAATAARATAIGSPHPTAASSATATPTSTAPPAPSTSTNPSSASPPPPPATATGSSPPTAASSATATPTSTAPPAPSTSTNPSSASPPPPPATATGSPPPTAASSPSATPTSTAPPAPSTSTNPSSASPPPPPATATGSSPPTAASSPSATPTSTAPPAPSTSTNPSSASPPPPPATATGSPPPTVVCIPTEPHGSAVRCHRPTSSASRSWASPRTSGTRGSGWPRARSHRRMRGWKGRSDGSRPAWAALPTRACAKRPSSSHTARSIGTRPCTQIGSHRATSTPTGRRRRAARCVFYRPDVDGPDGHVAISLGNGFVISTSAGARIGVSRIDAFQNPLGWAEEPW